MVKRTGRPGYLQIADDLRAQIADGRLSPGDSLPSTAQLREQYDVSAGVVKAAISVLRTEGLVVGQQGKGVFVKDQGATRSPAPPPTATSAADGALVELITEVLSAVRDLSERVARLEESTFAEQSTARRPGK